MDSTKSTGLWMDLRLGGSGPSNYMSLPIQFVAVLDILMIWESH